jgi:hypothetical protein
VINALWDNPKRKFSEVEMKFFTMWYELQNEKTRAKVKKLVDNG